MASTAARKNVWIFIKASASPFRADRRRTSGRSLWWDRSSTATSLPSPSPQRQIRRPGLPAVVLPPASGMSLSCCAGPLPRDLGEDRRPVAAALAERPVQAVDPLGDGTRLAVADRPAVDLHQWHDAARGAGQEHLVGRVEVVGGELGLARGKPVLGGQLE